MSEQNCAYVDGLSEEETNHIKSIVATTFGGDC